MASNKHHVRSISLPSRSHPSTARVEEQLNKLKAMEEGASTSSSSLSLGLFGLGELYECVDELLNMGSTQQVLSQSQREKWVEDLLEGSVKLLDVCGITRDVLMQTNERVQALQSSLRRRKGSDYSGVENNITSYTCFRKKMKKDVKKFTSTLKQVDKKFEASILEQDNNDHLYAVVRVLRQVCTMNISIFQSLLLFLTFQGSKPKSKWSLVAKLMHKGVIACEDQEKQICVINELENVDVALCKPTILLGDAEMIQTTQKRLKALENSIHGLESGLESVFRKLIKTRTSLLNIISQ